MECGILISNLSLSNTLQSAFKIENLLMLLTLISGSPDVDPEIKARALALRVLERCQWKWDEVFDLDDMPASNQVKQDCLREAREAMQLAKRHGFSNTALFESTLVTVKRPLGLPTKDDWNDVCAQAKSLELRDDLYFAVNFATSRVDRALKAGPDYVEIQAVLNDVAERYASLGEFGKLVVENVDRHWKPLLEQSNLKDAPQETAQSDGEVCFIQTLLTY